MAVDKIDLVATYEEYAQVPSDKCMTKYFGDYSLWVKKNESDGFDETVFNHRFDVALRFLGISEDEYLNNSDFVQRGKIKEAFNQKLYEIYKEDWYKTHNIPDEDVIKLQDEWQFAKAYHDFEGSFEDYEQEYGYNGGEIYACFDEFVENDLEDEETKQYFFNKSREFKPLSNVFACLDVEKTMIDVYNDKNSEKRIHYLGYFYNNGDGLKLQEYTGYDVPFSDVLKEGICDFETNHSDEKGGQQYVTEFDSDLSREEELGFINGYFKNTTTEFLCKDHQFTDLPVGAYAISIFSMKELEAMYKSIVDKFEKEFPQISRVCNGYGKLLDSLSKETLNTIEYSLLVYNDPEQVVYNEETGEITTTNKDVWLDAIRWSEGLLSTDELIELSLDNTMENDKDVLAKEIYKQQCEISNLRHELEGALMYDPEKAPEIEKILDRRLCELDVLLSGNSLDNVLADASTRSTSNIKQFGLESNISNDKDEFEKE